MEPTTTAQPTGTKPRFGTYGDAFLIGFMSTLGMMGAFAVMQNRYRIQRFLRRYATALKEAGQ